jgi:hypothetical protein
MASDVDIANLALSHLGDDASVSSLDPPEGSAQAEHCARFLPIARDALLEMHAWGFATRRANNLAQLASTTPAWRYAYALPAGALKVWGVTAADATDDLYGSGHSVGLGGALTSGVGYSQVEFETETLPNGDVILLTNEPLASARISVRITDPTKFTPLFVDALAWKLASHLAGPVLKGDAARDATRAAEAMVMLTLGKAEASDAQQQRRRNDPVTPWIVGR